MRHSLASPHLKGDRGVTVRLPDHYDPENKTYPVVYLQDGQNMFDRRTGFAGQEWGVDEAVAQLTQEGRMPESILVAIDNGGAARLEEYSHVKDPEYGGGRGEDYEKFVLDELIPAVETEYAVDPSKRVLLGSSMGGLVSLAMGIAHPGLFAAVGALSPSVWWADGQIADKILAAPQSEGPKPKIWLDMGTEEGKSDDFGTRAVVDGDFETRPVGSNGVQDVRDRTRETGVALLQRGWTLDQDLRYHEPLGGRHDEYSWNQRMDQVLPWLTKGLAS